MATPESTPLTLHDALPISEERWIGGVSGGIAYRLGIDPLIVRGGLVVLTFFGGLGLLLYGLGWAFLPEQVDGRIHAQEADRKSTRLNSTHVAISYAVF